MKWSRCRLRYGLGWAKELCIKRSLDPTMRRGTFEGDYVRIFWHAAEHRFQCWDSPQTVERHSNWPPAEAVKCHIRLSQWKIHPAMRPFDRILWPCLHFVINFLWLFFSSIFMTLSEWPLMCFSLYSLYLPIRYTCSSFCQYRHITSWVS